MTTRLAPAALILCAALAGCEKEPAPQQVENMAANAVAETDNAAEPSRSILRPEIVVPTLEPKIEPEEGVVSFGTSIMALDDAAKATLDGLIETPAMKAGGPITLRGHSDSRGSDGDNMVASRIRAEKVRDYLVEKGVDETRISLIALGEARPAAPNAKDDGSDDPDGRGKNRRVEVQIAVPPGSTDTPD